MIKRNHVNECVTMLNQSTCAGIFSGVPSRTAKIFLAVILAISSLVSVVALPI